MAGVTTPNSIQQDNFLPSDRDNRFNPSVPMPDEKLIVFVKAPRSGAVKTRLAASIGANAACTAYRVLVDALLRRIESVENVELRFTPDDAENEIRPWLRESWQAAPQGAGDLGERLHRAFEASFAEGARRVVAIGSDCPDVTAGDITAAWSTLETTDLVLGPASDGGYWLIGLRQPHAALFQNISWSTATVFQETLARAQKARLSVKLLRQLSDVDTEQQWREFLKRRKDFAGRV
jgi:rSAM/selenodomain-associated transferase 1